MLGGDFEHPRNRDVEGVRAEPDRAVGQPQFAQAALSTLALGSSRPSLCREIAISSVSRVNTADKAARTGKD
ncbi:hypothetical protein GCM10027088_39650 [Nocardia goodfellowii]